MFSRSILRFFTLLTLPTLLTPASASPLAWWFDGSTPIITGGEENNQGAANIGQAKYMVSEALRALDSAAPAIATQIRSDLAGAQPNLADRILDLTVPNPKPVDWADKQKAPLLIGQLKAISTPFYTRLNAISSAWLAVQRTTNGTIHPGSIFPWTSENTDDANKAVANIGQLKAVFSLRFNSLPLTPTDDADGDGLSDAAEVILDSDPNNMDSDGDGIPDGIDVNPLQPDIREFIATTLLVISPLH